MNYTDVCGTLVKSATVHNISYGEFYTFGGNRTKPARVAALPSQFGLDTSPAKRD